MAKLQVMTLDNLTQFKELYDADVDKKIEDAAKKSIKAVSISDDGTTIYFYKKEEPVTEAEAAYSIHLPSPVSIDGKTDKVTGAVAGNFAGLDASGNLVDSGKKATDFDAAGTAASVETSVLNYVGDIPVSATAKNVVAYITEVVQANAFDDSELLQKINANKDALTVLNGTGEGSVTKTVADAIAEIIAEAPESFDTLKEISDWIQTHASDAATMNSNINTNKNDIAALRTLIGTLPEGATSTTVVSYIAEYVQDALTNTDLAKYAKAEDLVAAVGRIDTLETDSSKTKDNVTALTERVTALENADTTTGEKITEIEGNITTINTRLTNDETAITKNQTDITSLKEIVGDGVEAIPSASIAALFA